MQSVAVFAEWNRVFILDKDAPTGAQIWRRFIPTAAL
jgi:hypothetical protein